MKQIVVAAACLSMLACASAGDKANIAKPEIQLVQTYGPAEQNFPVEQSIKIEYAARIANRADVPITLRQIQVESTGEGGIYMVPRGQYTFNDAIAAGTTKDVTFRVDAYSFGNRRTVDAQAPITIRGLAFFESPSGSFRQPFTAMITDATRRRE